MEEKSDRIEAQVERDVELQQLIDGLVTDGEAHSVEENEDRLRAALADQNLTGMPDPWVEAVAQSLAWGNAYVVSKPAEEHVDVPEPSNSPKYRDIT